MITSKPTEVNISPTPTRGNPTLAPRVSAPGLPNRRKAALVNLGLIALNHGWWSMVEAITCIVKGSYEHE